MKHSMRLFGIVVVLTVVSGCTVLHQAPRTVLYKSVASAVHNTETDTYRLDVKITRHIKGEPHERVLYTPQILCKAGETATLDISQEESPASTHITAHFPDPGQSTPIKCSVHFQEKDGTEYISVFEVVPTKP